MRVTRVVHVRPVSFVAYQHSQHTHSVRADSSSWRREYNIYVGGHHPSILQLESLSSSYTDRMRPHVIPRTRDPSVTLKLAEMSVDEIMFSN